MSQTPQLQFARGWKRKPHRLDYRQSCSPESGFHIQSQPLAVAFTEQESAGGRVWPNVIFDDTRFDYAFSVWGNSTLGLLSHWWHSSRQQSSKAGLTIRSADSLPVLDLRTLTDEQLSTAQEIFDDFRHRDLMPGLPSRRRPQSRPPRPPSNLRPPRLRPRHLPSRPPPIRQMVRRTLSPRRQKTPSRRHPGDVNKGI